MYDLEQEIRHWTDELRLKGRVVEASVAELEQHLRDEIAELREAGLDAEESFLIAMRRMGKLHEVAAELAKVKEAALWRQYGQDAPGLPSGRGEALRLGILGLLAALTPKALEWLGLSGPWSGEHALLFVSYAFLPWIAVLLGSANRIGPHQWAAWLGITASLAGVVAYRPDPSTQSFWVMALHVPLLLVAACGLAWLGKEWRSAQKRMDFIRLAGESFIYAVLLLLGVGVVFVILALVFASFSLEADSLLSSWLYPLFVGSAPVGAAWLALRKRSVIENIAPLLAKVFAPVFLALCMAITVLLLSGTARLTREVLIAFDLLLALALGLAIYILAARNPRHARGLHDWLSLALMALALAADLIALGLLGSRIVEWGISPNKLTAIGFNLLLFGNLLGLLVAGLRGRGKDQGYDSMIRFQAAYLPVYLLWSLFAAFALPPLFGFL